MAEIGTSGLANLIKELEDLGADIDEISDEMLEAGGEAMKKAWTEEIKAKGHVDTGDMLKSVKAKVNKSKKTAEIYPQGKDKKGVRNALKAFVLHYGTSNIAGDRFVDEVESKGSDAAVDAMYEIYSDELGKRGF